jgi:chromosome segregation ATPase
MRWDSVRRPLALVMLVVPAYVALSGCSSGSKKTEGEQRTAAQVGGLKDTRAELVAGKAQIDKTLASMNAMRDNQGVLQTEFATFNEEMKKTDAQSQKIRARAADMRTRATQYQAKWRDEMGKVEDPNLRAAATARANKVRERYDGITAKAQEARAAYEPFMKQLKSVQTYLSNDLTPAGVQSAASVFDQATAEGKTVTAKIDAVVAELDDVASAMSPAAGTAAAAPKK